ncbi:MAG: hypothetical protein WC043_10865 [Pseudobdellovibrionaceae bacterium]
MMRKFIEFVKERPFQGAFLVLCAAALIFVVSFLVWNNLYHALKVKDITDPRFDPMAYRFEDYAVEAESQKVLTYIFPVGTPREKVENLLVKKLGATPHKVPKGMGPTFLNGEYSVFYDVPYNPFLYQGPNPMMLVGWLVYVGGRYISIMYDRNDELLELKSMVP